MKINLAWRQDSEGVRVHVQLLWGQVTSKHMPVYRWHMGTPLCLLVNEKLVKCWV